MDNIVQRIIEAFPGYSVSASRRPDGLLLDFISEDKDIEFHRVLSGHSPAPTDVDLFIHEVRRELALLSGKVPPEESLQKIRDQGLPSYD